MTAHAYALADPTDVDRNADNETYLQRVDATREPFGGSFLVRGGRLTALEGQWDGAVVAGVPEGYRAAAG